MALLTKAEAPRAIGYWRRGMLTELSISRQNGVLVWKLWSTRYQFVYSAIQHKCRIPESDNVS